MDLTRRDVLLGAAGAAALALTGCSEDDAPTTSSSGATGPSSTTTSTAPTSSTSTSGGSDAYVPPNDGEWEAADTSGWRRAGLDDLIELAATNSSTTLMVLSGGRIVVEEYFGETTEASVQDIASCQKSVVSTLVGIARDRGLLDLDDPVSDHLAPGWSAARPADEATITIRHLLTMSSGLHPRTLRKVAEPGTTFEYNTDAYQKLRRVLESASGSAINPITRSWLFDAIGVHPDSGWMPRPGTDAVDAVGDPQWGLVLRARDLARFGLLALRDGVWGDDRLVPDGWFAEAWTPNEVARDYGYLWWLLGRRRGQGPNVPTDWVAALGARDQKIYVIPSLDLVLTRQGDAANETTEAGSTFDRQLGAALQGALA